VQQHVICLPAFSFSLFIREASRRACHAIAYVIDHCTFVVSLIFIVFLFRRDRRRRRRRANKKKNTLTLSTTKTGSVK